MDDLRFAHYLVRCGRLTREQVDGLRARLPADQRLATALVAEGYLTPDEARELWAAAGQGATLASPPPQPSEAPDAGATWVDTSPAHAAPRGETTRLDEPFQPQLDPAATRWSQADPAPPRPGERFQEGELVAERYRVGVLLGAGGMGAVYRAVDESSGQAVALKQILPSLADEAMLARFEREAQLAARVDKQGGVVRVHAIGEHRLIPYCVMELVEGRDLEQLLASEGTLAPERLARIVQAAAESLARCHAAGVVHRDVKPANLLLDEQEQPKLADFGLARDDTLERLTETGELLGTPLYMAPEQIDSPSEVDARADVYSLGAILFRGLTGRPPFQGEVAVVVRDVLLTDPPRPRKLEPRIPAELEAIVLTALAKEPRDRYASASALAEDLARFRAGEPVSAHPLGALARFRRRYARGEPRALALGRAVLGLALLLGVGLSGGGFLWARAAATASLAAHLRWEQEVLDPFALGEGEASLELAELDAARARLDRLPDLLIGDDEALATTRARLAAHRRLLAARAGQEPGPPGADPTGRLVEAILLAERADAALREGKTRQAERARRAALRELEQAAGSELLPSSLARAGRLRLELEVGPKLVALIARAPREPRDELRAQLAALAEDVQRLGADQAALGALKSRALEHAVPGWRAVFREAREGLAQRARGADAVNALLSRLGVVLHTAPAVAPGPLLRAELDALITAAVEALDRAHSAGRGGWEDYLETLRRVEQGLYYEIDRTPRPRADVYERLESFGKVATRTTLEHPLLVLRCIGDDRVADSIRTLLLQAALSSGERLRTVEAQWGWVLERLAELERSRPRSRAIRYARLVAARVLDWNELDLRPERRDQLPAQEELAQRYLRIAREAATGRDAEGPLLDDLRPRFAANAGLLWAGALNDLAQAYRSLERNEEARAYAERVRGVVLEALPNVPAQYVGGVFKQGGVALTTLSQLASDSEREALAAKRRAWHRRAQDHLGRLVERARAGVEPQSKLFLIEWIPSLARAYLNEALVAGYEQSDYATAERLAARCVREAGELSGLKRNGALWEGLAFQAYALRRQGKVAEARALLAGRPEGLERSVEFAAQRIELALEVERRDEARALLEEALKHHPGASPLRDLESQLGGD